MLFLFLLFLYVLYDRLLFDLLKASRLVLLLLIEGGVDPLIVSFEVVQELVVEFDLEGFFDDHFYGGKE